MTIRRNRIPMIARELDKTLLEAAEEALKPVVEEAQRRAPQPGSNYATGALRDSIHIEVDEATETARVVGGGVVNGEDVWYGHLVEFGSSAGGKGRPSIPPRPFLVPAFDMHRENVKKRIALANKRLVEEGKRET